MPLIPFGILLKPTRRRNANVYGPSQPETVKYNNYREKFVSNMHSISKKASLYAPGNAIKNTKFPGN